MTQTIEREAKLFEAGSYPDKGVEITEEDLDVIAAGTSDAPVRIEHMSTPFDGALGVLKSAYRRGKELFGRLSFTRVAWEMIKEANARRLSVAIHKDKSGIAEVSLVCEPRIADAAVFSADVVRFSDTEITLDEPPAIFNFGEVDALIDRLKREGKIVPASEVFARAILHAGDSSIITFGDQPTPISRIFRWFLDSQPKVIEFSELAPAQSTQNEPEIFAKLGVTSAQVEKWRGR